MDAKQEIIENLKKAVNEVISQADINIELQEPKDEVFGDYSSNIAMAIFGNSKRKTQSAKQQFKAKNYKNPMELAQEIAQILNSQLSTLNFLDKVEAAPPGFINFYLSYEYLIDQLQSVLDSARTVTDSGVSASWRIPRMTIGSALKNKKIMVEFTDPNPFKEFHIGHLYSNVVGESLSRLLESQGAEVWRVTYQGDVGLHVAKTLWGIRNKESGIMVDANASLKQRIEAMGRAYAAGTKAYEDNPTTKEEIHTLNKKIYQITNNVILSDPPAGGEGSLPAGRQVDSSATPQNDIKSLYEKGREWSLEYFESIYKRLGSKFVKNYFESVAGPIGLALVKDHIADGIFIESEGAIIFPGEKYSLHNRVFVNSLGLPTYEAKDMGLPGIKYKDFPYDESIIITAQEQSPYFTVVLKALSLINPDIAAKTKHIAHGVVRLPQGKMSSRTGNVITGEWLLDEAKQLISQNYPNMDNNTSEQVAVGSVKWAMLKNGIGRDIAFSFEESISFEGNSGPYLQYTYARTQSVLRKFQISNVKFQINTNDWKLEIGNYKLEIEEEMLLRTIARFPEVLEKAAESFSPNTVCTYLFDLGQKFNLFYQKCQILSPVILSETKDLDSSATPQNDNFRVAITAATGQVIKTGLFVLGIHSPRKM